MPVPEARFVCASRVSEFLVWLFLSRLGSRRRLSGGPDRFLNIGCGFHQVADVAVSINIPLPGFSILKLRYLATSLA